MGKRREPQTFEDTFLPAEGGAAVPLFDRTVDTRTAEGCLEYGAELLEAVRAGDVAPAVAKDLSGLLANQAKLAMLLTPKAPQNPEVPRIQQGTTGMSLWRERHVTIMEPVPIPDGEDEG